MNNKGMTVVEMVVTFSLTALVVTFLMQLLISVNRLQNSSGVKTVLLTKQANITKAIYKDLEYSDIVLVETDNHTADNSTITLSDGTTRLIRIDNGQNKKIIYNNKVYSYPNNTVISNLRVEDVIASNVDLGRPNSFVKISVDITYPNLKGQYGINIILPHDSSKEIAYKYYEGSIVYFDPINNITCTSYHGDNSLTGYNGALNTSTSENQSSCLKWYTFTNNDDSLINLILDHNTTDKVTETQAANKLQSDTSRWNASIATSARLISANEVSKITGANNFIKYNSIKTYRDNITDLDTQCSWFYLDGTGSNYSSYQQQNSSSNGENKYSWLFNNTNNCESYGCDKNDSSTLGYLTSTTVTGNSNSVWVVSNEGKLKTNSASSNDYGIRPVITINKSVLNSNSQE